MQITAIYEKTIYETNKDGVIVALYRVGDKSRIITGKMLPNTPGVRYVFTGDWITHKKYGEQFKAEYFSEDISDKESVVKFLSSNLIKGIGPVTAKKIVDVFGEDTIKILDEDIERVLTIKRFPKKKFMEFKNSYIIRRGARDAVVYLSKYGFSVKQALAVYEKFKGNTMDVIKKTPYQLSSVYDISFPMADRLGERSYDYERSYERFVACANYVLSANQRGIFYKITGKCESGSNGMQKDDFGKVMLNLLRFDSINGQFICDMTIKMISNKLLVYIKKDNDIYFYQKGLFNIERESAKALERIIVQPNITSVNIDAALSESKMKFDIKQKEAIKNAFKHNISLIVGIPGTGKTTIINTIAGIYHKENPKNKMYFLAPTGRASARIKETLSFPCMNVSTIHIALDLKVDEIEDTVEQETVFNDSLVIVDEMSMVDSRLFYRLVSAIGSNCRVIFCGDDEQLQSVSSGAVLRDLIQSKCICTTYLTKVFRQSEDSSIYENLLKIRKGDTSLIINEDFKFIKETDSARMEDMMIDKYLEKVREYGKENVMLISPFKQHDAGVYNLNNRIQEILNPETDVEMRGVYKYRIGDLVLQTKNDYTYGIMNGDIGTVTEIRIEDGEKVMRVKFGSIVKEYDKENLDELNLGYAYTIHKAQGCEAKCVITCFSNMHGLMLKRNVFYTAVTRASKEVCIFGEKEAVDKAITTQNTDNRVTVLKDLLQLYNGDFVSLMIKNGEV